MSFIEAATNVLVGYVVALMTQLAVFPLLGLEPSIRDNLLLSGIFTLVSLVRSYVLRRFFESMQARTIERSRG